MLGAVQVDGIGEWTGMGILTSDASKLKRVTEKEGWEAGQANAVRMLQYYKELAAGGDESAQDRIEETVEVIRGYSQFTGVTPSLD